MKTLTVEEFHDAAKNQGVFSIEDIAFVCPMCATVQSAKDFINAGVGADLETVEKYLGFSCVGRFLGAPSPRNTPDGKPCDWSLGGLFKCHRLEVITPDGARRPSFELATPEQAIGHAKGGAV